MRQAFLVAALGLSIAGCSSLPSEAPQSKVDREAQIQTAAHAVSTGNFEMAEKLMAVYLYRDKKGDLKFRSLGVSSDAQKKATDTVALLLWQTGRDASLARFADRYLDGYERDVMHCRIAERNAVFEEAYNCWNDLGDVDRARRSVRIESALRILKD